ncbi:MAG: tRNA lysidine(34) synthetase TilS [Planctomycetota bacterium]|nr:tRNA lysidine(34) synthetase TilS [Planctomycetota bacterium]
MIERKILTRWPIERWSNLTVVAGCSGGADSTALLVALHRLCLPTTTIVVAHFNHKLRGAETEADASFVRNLAERLQLQLVEGQPGVFPQKTEPIALATGSGGTDFPSERQSTPEANAYGSGKESSSSIQPKSGVEETTTEGQLVDEASLRGIRYQFLERTALQLGARYVAVGHHADDQVETVLHNLFRGSGLSGLRGMSAFRGLGKDLVLVRPMIDAWREEVIDYLKSHRQSFRSDSSNASESYTRNRIRNRLLPLIQEHYGRDVRSAVANAADLLGDVFVDVDLQSKRWSSENLVHLNEQQFSIPYPIKASPAWHIVQQSIVNEYHRRGWSLGGYSRAHWHALQAFLSGKHASTSAGMSMLPDHVTVRKTADGFVFERITTRDVLPPVVRVAESD